MVTDQSGKYRFTDLAHGIYHVRQVAPENLKEIVPITGVYNITLTAGEISKKNNLVNAM